jgi:hypothetical protein
MCLLFLNYAGSVLLPAHFSFPYITANHHILTTSQPSARHACVPNSKVRRSAGDVCTLCRWCVCFVCVRMRVYMYMCMCTCTCVCTCTCAYVHVRDVCTLCNCICVPKPLSTVLRLRGLLTLQKDKIIQSHIRTHARTHTHRHTHKHTCKTALP